MKAKSRTARWHEATADARTKFEAAKVAFDAMVPLLSELSASLSSLRSVQEEYEDWQGNLPENLQSSALAEKLEAVTCLDIEVFTDLSVDDLNDFGNVEELLDECEAVELPVGFGRD